MYRNQDCYNFALTGHVKQDRPGNVFGNVRLYRYTEKELCVYETVEHYIQCTKERRTSSRLIVSYIKPFKQVTSSTIGRWIKIGLSCSGIDTTVFFCTQH
jgi:hypothetical protein